VEALLHPECVVTIHFYFESEIQIPTDRAAQVRQIRRNTILPLLTVLDNRTVAMVTSVQTGSKPVTWYEVKHTCNLFLASFQLHQFQVELPPSQIPRCYDDGATQRVQLCDLRPSLKSLRPPGVADLPHTFLQS
jgi:hypothetical protein